MRRRSVVLASVASAALVTGLMGCGTDDYTRPSGTIMPEVADGKPCVEAQLTVATTPPGTDATGGTTPSAPIEKPPVSMPEGVPPTELKITDLREGTGDEVKEGDNVTAHYTGVSCSTGKQFDSSWDRGEPEMFSLSQVVEGWSKGLVGMKEGGLRHLVVPPGMAYGDDPRSEDILPGETLVFVVELIETTTPPPPETTTTTAAGGAAPDGATTTAPAGDASTTTTAAPGG